MLSVAFYYCYAECRYAKYHYAECCVSYYTDCSFLLSVTNKTTILGAVGAECHK